MPDVAGARKRVLRFVVLLGVVSLLADVTYEGARGIAGPYLGLLGASGAVVGFVGGFGELAGYGLRLVSGLLSDRTRKYWAITFVGYAINLLAVPALAFAGRWEVAAGLLMLERVGKAIRTPPRDAMLSQATAGVSAGWAFGLHEALDQIGALTGPLLAAAVLAVRHSYAESFLAMLVPAVGALVVLGAAWRLYPRPQDLAPAFSGVGPSGYSRQFWLYLAAVGLVAAGFVDFPLIAFHMQRAGWAGEAAIPLYYALAMGVDAIAALVFGRLYDRWGIVSLIAAAGVSALVAPLAFLAGPAGLAPAMVLWGVGMGAQESVMRAAVGRMVASERRGAAYGFFNACYGLMWFAGSAAMGLLYDRSLFVMVGLSATLPLLAIPLLWRAR